jgi:hypothetical protein
MFHVKNHKQLNLFDPWGHLGPKRRKLLDKSWAGLFQQKILPKLPIETLRSRYHDWNGRPTKELYSMMGMMVLQQMHDLTDDQAIEQFCFNMQWHYALNITNPSDAASYISHKTLWTMRSFMSTDETYNEIFDRALQTLAKLFKADLNKQRMDSVHVKSNMRNLGRIGLFAKTIKKFLVNLKRQHRTLFDQLDDNLTLRYLGRKEGSLFAMVKPSDSGRTLDQLAEDVFTLTRRFASVTSVHDMSSFKLLVRLFEEQCIIKDNNVSAPEPKAVARPNRDVPSDSLQNPSDPDSGYSSHKGQGYQVQVVESYTDGDDKQLSLITHVAVESADRHDAGSLLPALEKLQQREMSPQQILADSLYGSDSNCEKALKEHDVNLIAPVMPGNQQKMHLADFTINDQGWITSCPQGSAPIKVKKISTGFSASFLPSVCAECPVFKQCPVCKGKKAYYYRYKHKDVRLANRRRFESTASFKDKYRFRAGVEATMSEFDRRTGVKHLRVRGMKAVCFAAVMKAIGLNIFRASRYRKQQIGPLIPLCGILSFLLAIGSLIKEQFQRRFQECVAVFIKTQPTRFSRLKTAF